jgi:hypothetical protein
VSRDPISLEVSIRGPSFAVSRDPITVDPLITRLRLGGPEAEVCRALSPIPPNVTGDRR